MSDAPKSSPTTPSSSTSATPQAGGAGSTTPPTQPTPTPPSGGGGSGRVWLVAGITFLVGLVLGGLAISLTRSSGGSTVASGTIFTMTPSAAATSASSATQPDTVATVRVPAECIQVADDSKKVADLANQAVTAARDLNAAKLSDLVRQIGDAQNALTQHGNACRAVDATVTAGPSASPTVAPTSSVASTTP